MHRIVIFSEPVVINGENLYGKLYSGQSENEILDVARADLKRLLIMEQWAGKQGEEFRSKENWVLTRHEDGTETWEFDSDGYTNYLGDGLIIDQFVEQCWLPPTCIGIVSRWVPLKMAYCNDQDYIINRTLYEEIVEANPNDIGWTPIDEPEDDVSL